MPEETKVKLKPSQIYQLLKDVEGGKHSRQETNLLDLCDNHPNFYGGSGSAERRAFQIKWGYLKFLPIQQYLKLLESNDITSGKFTLQEKKKNEEDPKKNQATAKDSSTKTSTTRGSTRSTERLDDDSSELTPPD